MSSVKFISFPWHRPMGWLAGCGFAAAAVAAEIPAECLTRGQELYTRHCLACHQINGAGVPGVIPPLARSDYLAADIERGVRAICGGLTGEVVVNGVTYAGVMPPVVIDDADGADVLTFVLNSWENPGGAVDPATVQRVRATTRLKTFAQLQESSVYPPLPPAPEGFTVREVARMPQRPVRLASDGTGKTLFVLAETGDVWRLDVATGNLRQILRGGQYLEKRPGDLGPPLFVLAMTRDAQGRLYLGSNQQNDATKPPQNIVTIYRTTTFVDGAPAEPKVWFQTSYPGNRSFVHGLECIAFGPDGFLYANNGARTDGGQAGRDPKWYAGGELPVTTAIWRINPAEEHPKFEVIARGLRNTFGFCWNDRGEMFATENGPTADAPEELNLIERGKHYGFPYTYANWPPAKKAFPETPEPPAGAVFTPPIPNLGPDGGFAGDPIYTFDPHSSPAGIVFLGDDFPEGWRGSFVLARFGNMERMKRDVGYDVLRVALTKDAEGKYQAHVHTVLAPLGRPLDVHLSGRGKIYICEYTRATNNAMSYTMPGRVIELAVKGK